MTKLAPRLLSTTAILVLAVNAPALGAEDLREGSLYPVDVSAPVKLVAPSAPVAAPETPTVLAPVPVTLAKAETKGSLYPQVSSAKAKTPLGRALGSARYVLQDVGLSEDFKTEVRRAIGQHPVFHSQVSQRKQAEAGTRAERAALYPQLSSQLSGDYVLTRQFAATTDNVVESLRPREQFSAGLTASQLLFDGGATSQRIKGAKARGEETKQALYQRINQLALGGISAHYDVVTHQAIMKLGNEFITRHEKLLEFVKTRERLGAGSRAQVAQARARLAAARARVIGIKESARFSEITYKEFYGAKPGVLPRPSFDAVAVGSQDEAMTLAVIRNPAINAAHARSSASTADYKAARASRMPEIRAGVNAVKYDVFSGDDDYDVRATVNLNYDIYTGGGRKASIRQAGERARQIEFEEEQVRREAERDAAMAFERREAATERLVALETSVVANSETRALISERFRVSRGELIDLLQAENDYFEAGVAYLIGLADHDMATYALMEHTGDLLRYFSPQTEYAGPAWVENGEAQ